MADFKDKRAGNYVIHQKVGEGGFASVYLAQHTVLDKKAAVKFLLEDWVNEPDVVARFFDEARTMEKLHGHPNVITIIDIASKEQCEREGLPPYFIMDFVDGASLEEKIHSDEAFTLEFIIKVSTDTLSALGHCHKMGIVHRDIKPSNILLTKAGQVILTDFGIAKAKMNTSKTGDGIALGSTDYMSPEQALGKRDLDHRSDIYSFGITLYEMVVGKLPFIGDNPNQVAIMHIQDEPVAPVTVNPDVPPKLNTIIMRAIAKRPEDRFQTCVDFVAALDDLTKAPAEPEKVEISVNTMKITAQRAELPEDAMRRDEAAEAAAMNLSPAHLSRISGSRSRAMVRNVAIVVAMIGTLVGVFLGGATLYRQMTVGNIAFESVPKGAAVTFDDKVVGTTPCNIKDQATGWHKVTIEVEGYHRRVEQVYVTARETVPVKRELRKIEPQAMAALTENIANCRDAFQNVNSKVRGQLQAQAMAAIEKTLSQYPFEEKVHVTYLQFCTEAKLLTAAETYYLGQKSKWPTRQIPWVMLGLAHLRLGKKTAPIKDEIYNNGYRLDQYSVLANNAVGEYYETENDMKSARDYYNQSLYLDPDQPTLKEHLGITTP